MSTSFGDHCVPLMHLAKVCFYPPTPPWTWPYFGFVPWTSSDVPNQALDLVNFGEAGGEKNIRKKNK